MEYHSDESKNNEKRICEWYENTIHKKTTGKVSEREEKSVFVQAWQ